MNVRDWEAWAPPGTVALFGCWIIILNYLVVVEYYRHGRHHSRIPLLGGALLTTAIVLSPLPRPARFAWIPFVIDPGCLLLLVAYGARRVAGQVQAVISTPPNMRLKLAGVHRFKENGVLCAVL